MTDSAPEEDVRDPEGTEAPTVALAQPPAAVPDPTTLDVTAPDTAVPHAYPAFAAPDATAQAAAVATAVTSAPEPMPGTQPTGASSAAPAPPFAAPENYGIPLVPPAQIDPEAAARKARRRRNALRWTGAVAATAIVGTAIAVGVAAPKRTDIPGLGTPSDGRYDFPALTLPTLPAGQAAPGDTGNAGAQHLADIRKLLLPLPHGAVADHALPGSSGWVSASDALALSTGATTLDFAKFGLRHTAGEAWTTSWDGATTKIYILQFIDNQAADGAGTAFSVSLTGVPSGTAQLNYPLPSGFSAAYSQVTSAGKVTRYGTFDSGDCVVLVVQSGPASLPIVPFEQVLTLQSELLQ